MREKVQYENLRNFMVKISEVGSLRNLILNLLGFSGKLRIDANQDFSGLNKDYNSLSADYDNLKTSQEQYEKLKLDYANQEGELKTLKDQLAEKKAEEKNGLNKFSAESKSFEDAKNNYIILKNDLEKAKEKETKLKYERIENQFRIHENEVIKSFSDYCKMNSLTYYVKADSPINGDPEITVEIGGMYYVFDAKSNRLSAEIFNIEDGPQKEKIIKDKVKASIANAVRDMEKYAQENVFSTLYLVAPLEVFNHLDNYNIPFKKAKGGVQVIPIQQFSAIIQTFKILDAIPELKDFDPEKKSKIMWLIGQYRHHNNLRTKVDVLFGENDEYLNGRVQDIFDEDELKELESEEKKAYISLPNDSQKKLIDQKELKEYNLKLKSQAVKKGLLKVAELEDKK